MGVSLLAWLAEKMGRGKQQIMLDEIECDRQTADIYVRELSFWACVNLIANAISKCEFKTFVGGKEYRGREYYLWNYSPNRNQNSSGFIHKWIGELYRNNESLLVSNRNGDQIFVADSFASTPNTMFGDSYNGVTVDQYTFPYSFPREDVLYYRLSSQDMAALIGGLYDSYRKLIESGIEGYRTGKRKKALFKYETIPVSGSDDRKAFDELVNARIKTFMNAESAALPLGKGQNLEEYGKQYATASQTSRDVRAMIDDITDFTARAFLVPPVLLNGSVQDTSAAVQQMLTFCIDPLAEMLSEEINRQRYGYDGFQRGDRLVIDTRTIEHIDLLNMAPNVDKLISSGCYSINDIRRAAGDTEIDEPWANEHFITRNYTAIEEALKTMNGETGEDNAEDQGTPPRRW